MGTVFVSAERCKTCLSHSNRVAAKRYSFELKTDGCLRVEPDIFGVTVLASLPVKVALDLIFLFLFYSKALSTLFLIIGTAQQLVRSHFTQIAL